MQNNRKTRTSQVQSPAGKGAYSSYKRNDNRSTLILLGVLCIIVPPVGILLTWRAQNLEIPVRGIFSAAGLAATTLLFFLLMKPTAAVSSVSPVPATPQLIGYGAAATEEPAPVVPAPVQPAAAVPAAPSGTDAPAATQELGELTDDTVVYAVTNNASSYHLYQICDSQENHRGMMLWEALAEGLEPCEKCVGAKG